MGLQFEPSELPAIQKQIIKNCNLRGKPVITATQMLNSMQFSRRPTRAEPNDVFNAILDGSDAVMLSDETAKGDYPVDAVSTLASIARNAEKYYYKIIKKEVIGKKIVEDLLANSDIQTSSFGKNIKKRIQELEKFIDLISSPDDIKALKYLIYVYKEKIAKNNLQETTNLISLSACQLSEVEKIAAIITTTASGRTARMLSRFRPSKTILAAAYDELNAKKMNLSFGVFPFNIEEIRSNANNPEEVATTAINKAKSYEKLLEGCRVIYVGGTPLGVPGTTNLIQIKECI